MGNEFIKLKAQKVNKTSKLVLIVFIKKNQRYELFSVESLPICTELGYTGPSREWSCLVYTEGILGFERKYDLFI